jgi:cation diffusion facilitator family transporter
MVTHLPEEYGTAADPALTEKGLRTLKVSYAILVATVLFQAGIVVLSGSAALLADTVHNFFDAFTAIPLWIAFLLSQRRANKHFTYGYSRAEDLAAMVIVLAIFLGAAFTGYESYQRLVGGEPPVHLPLAIGAALLGALVNEGVARYRIRVGREIGSATLVADGEHARVDALTSLAAFLGLLGVSFGYPEADPLMGLLITVAILSIGVKMGKEVLYRLLDAIEPEMVKALERHAASVPGVKTVHDIRARWIGREVRMELHVGVDGELSVIEGHRIAEKVRHALLHRFPRLSDVTVHIDPAEKGVGDQHTLTAHHFLKGGEGGGERKLN